jgi:hypothetical protein
MKSIKKKSEIDHIHALLWSSTQDALHSEPIRETARRGMLIWKGKLKDQNYIPIAFGTQAEVLAIGDAIRKVMRPRRPEGKKKIDSIELPDHKSKKPPKRKPDPKALEPKDAKNKKNIGNREKKR